MRQKGPPQENTATMGNNDGSRDVEQACIPGESKDVKQVCIQGEENLVADKLATPNELARAKRTVMVLSIMMFCVWVGNSSVYAPFPEMLIKRACAGIGAFLLF